MAFRELFRVAFGIILILHEISALNSKLDFGDDSKPSIISSNQRTIPFKYEHVRTGSKQTDNLDNIGIVCTSTGCDTTKTDGRTQQVKTDVVVQVKSVVDIANATKIPEEVPDIPVVLGTKDVGKKNNYPIVERGLQFHPVSRNFQENNVPLARVNIGDAFPSLMQTINPYEFQSRPGIDVQMKPFVGMVSIPDGYKYKTDGLEIMVPYFEPTYHKHYYGENTPPQYAYYPHRKTVQNPVAFNNIARPTYSFPAWKQNLPSQNRKHDENCVCQNQSRLMWYPSSGNQVTLNNNAQKRIGNNIGMIIDDKLAPIN